MKPVSHPKRPRAVILALSAAAIIALIVGIATFRPATPESAAAAVAAKVAQVRWPASERLVYSVAWKAKTEGEIAPSPQAAAAGANGLHANHPGGAKEAPAANLQLGLESEIAGEVAIERVAGAGAAGTQRLALSFARIDRFAFSMQGKQAAGDAAQVSAAMVGKLAFLEVDGRGRISSIAFADGVEPGVAEALRSLALQLGYTLPENGASGWEAVETTPLGEASVRYRSSAAELDREIVRYARLDAEPGSLDGEQSLSGGCVIALDSDGVPQSIEESSAVRYTRPGGATPSLQASTIFSLHRTSQGPASASLAQQAQRGQPRPLSAKVADPGRQGREDLRLAQGVTFDSIALAIDRFEKGARPGHEFLLTAAAYLRVHPEQLGLVVSRFQEPSLTRKGRGMLLDVLAQAGTAQAQKAMRDALSTEQARKTPDDFSVLVQRFSFVVAPDRESVSFLERTFQGARGSIAAGTAVAMGGMAGRLAAQRDLTTARELDGLLRAALQSAHGTAEQRPILAALGNAAQPEDLPEIVAHAADADPMMRDQVAASLRSLDTPEARGTLLSLAGDASTGVAMSAFASLGQQSLSEGDWRRLSALAQSGGSPVTADPALVDLVREKGNSRPEAREILVALLKRNASPDNDLQAIIRAMLQPG